MENEPKDVGSNEGKKSAYMHQEKYADKKEYDDSDDGINIFNPERYPGNVDMMECFYEPLSFFKGQPFDREKFIAEQSYLLKKVDEAIVFMEQEIDEIDWGTELLSSAFQINAWKRQSVQLKESIEAVKSDEKLEHCILKVAVTFYRELLAPTRSINQFNYLLHISPNNPDHWGSYALCLLEMAERCMPSTFDMEKRSSECFLRGARLALAHMFAGDDWYKENGREDTLALSREYYYNASDAYPNYVSRIGVLLVKMISAMEPLPSKDELYRKELFYEGEDLKRELRFILDLSM